MSITTRSGKGAALTHAEMDANLGYLVPAGAVMAFAMNSAPTGWIECSGNAVSRTTYADLFAAIGTTFGAGDSSTTFNLPNLRGEFIRGWDNGRGVDDSRAFGSAQGDATALPNTDFTTNTTGTHSHSYDGGDRQNVGSGGQSQPVSQGGNNTGSAGSHSHTIEGGDDETRPRNIAMLYCIKI